MGWIKLERGNDWGFAYLAVTAKTPQGTCNAQQLRHPFAEGYLIDIKWPDDTEEAVEVRHRKMSERVSDHGHSSTAHFELPGFKTSKNGHTFWVALDEVRVSDVGLDVHRKWVEEDPTRDPNRR